MVYDMTLECVAQGYIETQTIAGTFLNSLLPPLQMPSHTSCRVVLFDGDGCLFPVKNLHSLNRHSPQSHDADNPVSPCYLRSAHCADFVHNPNAAADYAACGSVL